MIRDERVQPLVRQVSKIHVIEEARHVGYAREALARRMPRAGRLERPRNSVLRGAGADRRVGMEAVAAVWVCGLIVFVA